MRASIRAEGTTFRPIHTSDPAGTEDLDGRESTQWCFTQKRSRCGKPRLFRPPGLGLGLVRYVSPSRGGGTTLSILADSDEIGGLLSCLALTITI